MAYLLITEIGVILGLNQNSLNKKAKRQEWAFYTDDKNPGSPIHIYPLDRLPDEIQIAWAGWDDERYRQARIEEELKGKDARVDRIPKPVSEDQAKQALAMPARETWLKQFPPGQAPRKNKRIYDGKSQGLCSQAREIILQRFPQLAHIKPGQKTRQDQPEPEGFTAGESSNSYGVNVRSSVAPQKMDQAAGSERPGQTILELKNSLQECREDKRFLQDSFRDQLDFYKRSMAEKDRIIEEKVKEKERVVAEKDRMIEQLRQELAGAKQQAADKDLEMREKAATIEQLNSQVNDLHQELHFKNEQLLKISGGQKRESIPVVKDNKTPSTSSYSKK